MIVMGLAGTLIARKFIVKTDNEVWGMSLTLVAMIPFLILCCFIAKLHISVMLVSLCIIAALQSMTVLFNNTFDMAFAKYGKSGAVAGKFGWTALLALWPMLTIVAILALCFAVNMFKKFKTFGI